MNKTSVERIAYSSLVSSIEYRVSREENQFSEAISIRLLRIHPATIFNNLCLFSREMR